MEHGVVEREETAQPDSERFLYGLIAEFENPDDLVAAARRTRAAGYRRIDAYSTPVSIPIVMHPGVAGSESTLSFHHSLPDLITWCAQRPVRDWPLRLPVSAGLVGPVWPPEVLLPWLFWPRPPC